ncbi:hypothetical protein DCAR_0101150 [Daucus carota subsp. sativus]|uniref:Uncharacterized protein n=1 Tax=Daucus carota subsp. sativus TaxID=79200 RepID=A0AAF1AJ06_DAUCS|nr:hypothetical protein DCAR_0101150 [Daucus carota subsp. sativus]
MMAEKNLDENTGRLLVRAKPMFLKRVVDNLLDVQRQWVVETGFEKVLVFNINEYPQPLTFLIVKSYKSIDSRISIDEKFDQWIISPSGQCFTGSVPLLDGC